MQNQQRLSWRHVSAVALHESFVAKCSLAKRGHKTVVEILAGNVWGKVFTVLYDPVKG